jgi:restriction system protein
MIPDFQTLMLPLLRCAADDQLRQNSDYESLLAKQFDVSEEERAILTQSGHRRFGNRVRWASVYLKKAGLLEYPQRGLSKITAKGYEILKDKPDRIDLQFLSRFPEIQKFREPSSNIEPTIQSEVEKAGTPEEDFEVAFEFMQANLAEDVLEMVKKGTPAFLEKLVIKLVLAMGYGGSKLTPEEAGTNTGRTGDAGIDGIVYEDTLGLDQIFLQAKKWSGTIGRPELQRFVGALLGQRARKGIFITTSSFTKDAIEYAAASDYKIILIDGKRLAELMIKYDVGVSVEAKYEIKKIDSDFFQEANA